MGNNPFEELAASLANLTALATEIREAVKAPRNEWEAISAAMKLRRKARLTLLEMVKQGRVRSKTVPSLRGRHQTLLSTQDLDEIFPIRERSGTQ